MVLKHPKCVVQSYLQWLQDSDYNANCAFCEQELADEACVRLVCYHVFHWVCLDKWARSLPADTAPAGYTCPNCNECIFPPDNLVSPVADSLRRVLSEVNWARAGLGMPLLEERKEKRPEFSVPAGPRPTPEGESGKGLSDGILSGTVLDYSTPTSRSSISKDAAKMMMAASSPSTSVTSTLLASPTSTSSHLDMADDDDTDENKYKRRSAVSWFARWWRSVLGPALFGGRRRATKTQKQIMTAILVLAAIVTLIVVFSHFGRSEDEYNDDPMLDPLNNPNIRVGKVA